MKIDEANEFVSCIIRFHDPNKLERLGLALSSLALQTYPFVEPIIMLQNFTAETSAAVAELAGNIPWPDSFLKPIIINFKDTEKGDHRSKLINQGIDNANGKYIAFLDYDDLLYPNCYQLLISRLKKTGKVIAFGGVIKASVEDWSDGFFVFSKENIFQDKNKLEFFAENQYPIHTFVLNKYAIDPDLLHFDTNISKNEDYAFLLKILSLYDWDTYHIRQPIAEYSLRVDGSNTNTLGAEKADPDKVSEWNIALRYIDNIRENLLIKIKTTDLINLIHFYRKKISSGSGEQSIGEEVSIKGDIQSIVDNVLLKRIALAIFGKKYNSLIMRSRYHLDGIDRGRKYIRIHGWAARTSALLGRQKVQSPLVICLFSKKNGVLRLLDMTVPNIPRPDVNEFLGTVLKNFGFDLQTEAEDDILLQDLTLSILYEDGCVKSITSLKLKK